MRISPSFGITIPMLTPSPDKRYTCINPTCLPPITSPATAPTYYPTWTSLQHHLRTAHPPTCVHPTCHGKTFSSQKGLRAHQKIHEEREVEVELELQRGVESDDEDGDGEESRPRKRRRGGEMGRDWKCDVEGCGKDFKSVRVSRFIHISCDDHDLYMPNIEKSTHNAYECHPSRQTRSRLSTSSLWTRVWV